MKILFLTENFPPETNAAATRVFERACYWVEAGHEITVITSAPNFPEGRLFAGYRNRWRQVETMSGIRVVRVKTFISRNEGILLRTLDFISFMCSAVFFGLFERRPDVVSATSPQFFAAVGGWALAACRRLPFVFELGDLWPASIVAVGAMRRSMALRLIERLELFLYRRAASVVALTPAFKDNLIGRGISADKIAVVINGVDGRRYGPTPRNAEAEAEFGLEECFTVGYVGTHGMAHALDNVLRTADLLRNVPRLRFLFVGAGATRNALIDQAENSELSNVVFVPMQPKERMPAIWSVCDVALVHLKDAPNFAEVIPSKIFEAMAMGLPLIVAAPTGEATRIVEREKAGLTVGAEDPEALGDAVMTMVGDEDARQGFAAASLAAAPNYSRKRQAELMMAALVAAAEGRGAQAGAERTAVGDAETQV